MSLLAAVLVPHPPLILHDVGRGAEYKIEKTIEAYKKAMRMISSLEPDTVIVITPHSSIYNDYFHISPGFIGRGNMRKFGSDSLSMEISYDQTLANDIAKISLENNIAAGTKGELLEELDHATFIPLHFLNEVYNDYKVVRISPSGLSPLKHFEFGKSIATAVEKEKKNVVVVISGDLSHKLMESGPYGYSKEGPVFDSKVINIIENGNLNDFLKIDELLAESAAECGLRPLQILAGILDDKSFSSSLLSYEGPFGVGYAVATFEVISKNLKMTDDEYVKLAKASVEFYVHHGKKMRMPIDIPTDLLLNKGGVFVSIKEKGNLRGCIGTISPTTSSLGQEIIDNAVAAAAYDLRFYPIKSYELEDLTYSVDVLSEPEQIDSTEKLNVKKYGIVVESNGKRGLLLPDLDGINSVEQQINIAKQKAGISVDDKIVIYRFTVERHS